MLFNTFFKKLLSKKIENSTEVLTKETISKKSKEFFIYSTYLFPIETKAKIREFNIKLDQIIEELENERKQLDQIKKEDEFLADLRNIFISDLIEKIYKNKNNIILYILEKKTTLNYFTFNDIDLEFQLNIILDVIDFITSESKTNFSLVYRRDKEESLFDLNLVAETLTPATGASKSDNKAVLKNKSSSINFFKKMIDPVRTKLLFLSKRDDYFRQKKYLKLADKIRQKTINLILNHSTRGIVNTVKFDSVELIEKFVNDINKYPELLSFKIYIKDNKKEDQRLSLIIEKV